MDWLTRVGSPNSQKLVSASCRAAVDRGPEPPEGGTPNMGPETSEGGTSNMGPEPPEGGTPNMPALRSAPTRGPTGESASPSGNSIVRSSAFRRKRLVTALQLEDLAAGHNFLAFL